MRNSSNRLNRFLLRNRDKGIPNLILYIVLGCGVVSVLYMLGYDQIYDLLCFDRAAILRGQLWRLFTYVFTMTSGNIFLTLILLYCYYSLGNALERSWGTLRFNLYYLSGIVLMDIFAMAFGGISIPIQDGSLRILYNFSSYYTGSMVNYLHLSLLICFATTYPDTRFFLFFFIPIRAWILALIYLGVTLFEIVSMTIPHNYFPHNLFPLVALANYFIFMGKDVGNLIPLSWRVKAKRTKRNRTTAQQAGPIPFHGTQPKKESAPLYTHRCTVCGRTDVSNPELDFRYCSRCNGYFCYCEDHISNHTHVE